MSPSPIGAPPIAPAIAAQQVPLAQFAQQAAAGNSGGMMPPGAGDGMDQKMTSLGLVQSLLGNVGGDLEKAAKVLVVVMPEVLPVLKAAVQALAMLNNEVTKQISPDNSAATQEMPQSSAGAVSAST